jgi:hypothetical protein
VIRAALAYAARGHAVIPLDPGGKRPLTRRGVYDASAEPGTVARWWTRCPRANIGLAVRPEWIVIDVDVRSGGLDTMKLWPTLPPTPAQITATGGMHFVFLRPPGELRGKAGKGVDVLGRGRYIVTAPSVREGVSYAWARKLSTTPVAECPKWLADTIVVPPARPVALPSPIVGPNVVERARKYLAAIPGAVSGQNGHATTFKAAQALVRGFMLDEETAYQLLAEWNRTCSPPWRERELRHKIKSAGQRATMAEGALLGPRT